MRDTKYNIAIDGPAGAGKSTVAKKVADRLGLTYIDTGAMYRAITFLAIKNHKKSVNEIVEIAKHLPIAMCNKKIYIDDQDITDEIRSLEVTQKVSEIAKIPQVRCHMTILQRKMADKKGSILDGRDIGTTVLPDADFKFYLTAGIEERSRRRYEELLQKGVQVDLSQIQEDISTRDREDSERRCSPLMAAKDAIVIDTTNMTVDDVVEEIVQYIVKGGGCIV